MSSSATLPSIAVVPKTPTWGLIFSILGILVLVGSLSVEFFILDHGSSNQLTIDAQSKTSIWGALTGVIFLVVGFVLWLWFSEFKNKYLPVFMLSLLSYIAANTAIMLSLYQVQVTST
jgi:hypothetical protein